MESGKIAIDGLDQIDFKQIYMNIRKGRYRYLGMGSGRIVFDLGNGYVVKVARSRRGIGQNRAEYKIASSDDSGLFAGIPAVSKRSGYLIMNKAEGIRDISYVWDYFHVKNNQELFQVPTIQEISQKYGLLLWDLGRAVNWGQINGKPVIIDYGFTKAVRRNYYLPPIFRK